MTDQLFKYNPGFKSDAELLAEFPARPAELELLLESIKHNIDAPANQHILVLGPRGIGKTTLVLRAAAEVRSRADLCKYWLPVAFSEESYMVCSLGEFWLEACRHIAAIGEDERWINNYKALKEEQDERRLRDRALGNILDFADQQQKRLLFIVENLQMLLGEQISDSDAWDLRGTLQNEPRMMLLATATTRFSQIEKIDKAFYEVFKPLELQPLDEEACENFWEARTGVRLTRRQMRPISILTGGNPRLLAIIAGFAAKTSFEDLMSNLTHLVDEHTDYFKSYLDNLPVQGRKIFVTLAELWDPVTAREVAKAARMEVSKTSAQLLRLADEGRVLVEIKGKKQRYQVAERMYNIYYLMRNRGNSAKRTQALVRFMLSFYSERQLIQMLSAISKEFVNCVPGEQATDLFHFFSSLIDNVSRPILKQKLEEIVSHCMREWEEKAEKHISAMEKEAELLGEYLSFLKQGTEFASQASYKNAEMVFRKAIELNPNEYKFLAWALLGDLLSRHLERYSEAEAAYRKAIELKPDEYRTWAKLGSLLYAKLGRYAEAEAAYRKVIELKPDNAWAWRQLGELLHEKLERFGEAEAAYRKAIEMKPDYAWAWVNLGQLLLEKPEHDAEAEAAYRKAFELEPNGVNALILALMLYKQEKYQEAIDLLQVTPNYEEHPLTKQIQSTIILLCTALASRGYSKRVLAALQKSPGAPQLEPLICALRMDLGEEVNIAQEIKEVAKDILANIQEQRKKLGNELAPGENKA